MYKRQRPKSDWCVTGIYIFDYRLFEFLNEVSPSKRGEYEITSVIQKYIDAGSVDYSEVSGWWTDAGTHESYQLANRSVEDL